MQRVRAQGEESAVKHGRGGRRLIGFFKGLGVEVKHKGTFHEPYLQQVKREGPRLRVVDGIAGVDGGGGPESGAKGEPRPHQRGVGGVKREENRLVRRFGERGAGPKSRFRPADSQLLLTPAGGIGFLVNRFFLENGRIFLIDDESEEGVDPLIGIHVDRETVGNVTEGAQFLFKGGGNAGFQGGFSVQKKHLGALAGFSQPRKGFNAQLCNVLGILFHVVAQHQKLTRELPRFVAHVFFRQVFRGDEARNVRAGVNGARRGKFRIDQGVDCGAPRGFRRFGAV